MAYHKVAKEEFVKVGLDHIAHVKIKLTEAEYDKLDFIAVKRFDKQLHNGNTLEEKQ